MPVRSILMRSCALAATVALASTLSIPAAAQSGGAIAGAVGAVSPDAASDLAPAIQLTARQREAMQMRMQDRRDALAAGLSAGHPYGLDTSSHPTGLSAESEANSVGRNFRNTRAQVVSSTLAEPAAANDGVEVFYGGNTYFSRSANHGATWVAEAAIPAGPADAPFACCDLDAVHHGILDTTFHIVLYTNSAQTNGVVRIFVRRSTIAGGVDCTYTIDPGGTANNVLPDYPHLGVSNNFVYLTTNNLRAGSWIGSQIRRFNASQMANCLTSSTTTHTYVGTDGQRILTPVENATSTQYFGLNRTANLFRVIRYPEGGSTIFFHDRTLSHGTQFINSDCRGGTGNFDFIERSTSWSIGGFRLRGAVVPGNRVWFLWNAGRDASHLQAHLHSAIVSEPGMALLASPSVFNQSTCFGYPTLGANSFAEFGLTLAFGGRNLGGGAAARGAIAVDDAASAGNFFPTLTLTASGTHNRSDGRYGDYFTLRRNDACPNRGWVATNFALLNGATSSAHVNARYVEFQSSLQAACP